MSRIVAARFDTFDEAQAATRALRSNLIVPDEVDVMYVTPPGQHAQFPVGGDELADKGARKSTMGAVAGAVVGGGAGAVVGASVVAPVAGPVAGATSYARMAVRTSRSRKASGMTAIGPASIRSRRRRS